MPAADHVVISSPSVIVTPESEGQYEADQQRAIGLAKGAPLAQEIVASNPAVGTDVVKSNAWEASHAAFAVTDAYVKSYCNGARGALWPSPLPGGEGDAFSFFYDNEQQRERCIPRSLFLVTYGNVNGRWEWEVNIDNGEVAYILDNRDLELKYGAAK